MNDTNLWAIGWVSLFVTLTVIVGMAIEASKHTDKMIVEAIKNGANPIEARCAITMPEKNDAVCLTKLSGGK